ncbi:MAG: family 43 glycosylhydrolase [Verrucomicrobiota bacterium]
MKALERQGSGRQKETAGSKYSKAATLLPVKIDSGEVTGWRTYGGEWKVVDGVMSIKGSPAKAVIDGVQRKDFELNVEVRAKDNSQAGIIFRVSNPQPAIDRYEGYYIGIHAKQNLVLWGASDGTWKTIASRPTAVPANEWMKIRLIVRGEQVQGWINEMPVADGVFPKFDGVDYRYGNGSIGLRALGPGAEFRNLVIEEAPPKPEGGTYTNPVQSACADPGIILHDGVYYAFCTYTPDFPNMPRGIRLYTSKNLAEWEDKGFAITSESSWGDSRFWAPDIIEKDGEFFLYYAADTRICVAKASHPAGPFQQIGDSPMEPDSIRIDAHVFQDEDDKSYFYYVKFNNGNEIWGGELNDDMVSVKPDTLRMMVKPDQPWEQHEGRIVEGPEILKQKGVYYLTYSGSHFESPEYAVGYATSDSPLGPWEKYTHNPVMKSTTYAHGTAHHDFTTSPDGTETFIVYHRHFSLAKTEPRRMAVDRVQFVAQKDGPDILEIHGPTGSPQPIPSGAPTPAPAKERPNVLLFFIDDLKPMTRDYGHPHMHTPNFDRLASQGVRFENAYCQVPTCGASRASLMTSLYPTTTRFPDFKCWAEKDAANQPTLPQRFREAGYVTISNGKVFHHQDDTEDRSWSAPAWRPEINGRTTYNDETAKFIETSKHTKKTGGGNVIKKPVMFEKGRVDPMETNDGLIAAKTMADLERLAESDKPFFIACGFAKPHMPFYSPAPTWKPYPLKGITTAEHRVRPEGMPTASRQIHEQFAYVPMMHDLSREIKYNTDLYHRYMRQGYYASVTHADDLLGRILDKMESLGLDKNTYVVVLGDHGWLLGEHNEWAKNTLLHEALRTAMWMTGPSVSKNAAANTFVEFVDIHPTLCELAGIEVDPTTIHGKSFVNVLRDPDSNHRDHAYTRFQLGDTLSSKDFQYALWTLEDGSEQALLIDRNKDPLGKKNVSGDSAYADVETKLRELTRGKIRKATGK